MADKVWKVTTLILGLFLFLGGLGIRVDLVQYFGILVGLLLLIIAVFLRGKLSLPKGSVLYGLFLASFLISLAWSDYRLASFNYLTLFIAGGLFWLAFYNLEGKRNNYFERIILFLGLLFGGLVIATQFLSIEFLKDRILSLVTAIIQNHHHIGDYWTLVLILVIYKIFHRKKYFYALLFLPGIYFLVISFSRSAYLAMAVGTFFIFYKSGWLQKYKKLATLIFAIIVGLFLVAGLQKSTLASRPYFLQSIFGLIQHPFGVGVGGFGIISVECGQCFGLPPTYSVFAHNLILELFAGMGAFAVVFIAWLVQAVNDIFKIRNIDCLLPGALFLSLSVNFLFDFTYFIPTMLWLWFMALGQAQGKQRLARKFAQE